VFPVMVIPPSTALYPLICVPVKELLVILSTVGTDVEYMFWNSTLLNCITSSGFVITCTQVICVFKP